MYVLEKGRKSSNLVKSHEVISHFIRGYLVPPPFNTMLKIMFDKEIRPAQNSRNSCESNKTIEFH